MYARFQIEARLVRYSAGRYDLDGVYAVEHTKDGWRWYKHADPSIGSEWRSTKREAVNDLTAYLNNTGE